MSKKYKYKGEYTFDIFHDEKTRYPGIAFSMLDGKDYKTGIWRLVRPKGLQTFKRDVDA